MQAAHALSDQEGAGHWAHGKAGAGPPQEGEIEAPMRGRMRIQRRNTSDAGVREGSGGGDAEADSATVSAR